MLIKDLEAYVQEEGFKLGHYPQSMISRRWADSSRRDRQVNSRQDTVPLKISSSDWRRFSPTGRSYVSITCPTRDGSRPPTLFLGSEALCHHHGGDGQDVPDPEAVWKQAYRVKTMRQGLEVIRQIMRTGIKPAVVRLHDWLECEKPYGAFMEENESMLLFWSEGRKEIAEAEGAIIDEIAKANGAVSAGEKPLDLWYVHRNDAADDYESTV